MRRLWVQQTLTFSLVVIVIMGVVAFWINRSAGIEFRKYVSLREARVPGPGMQELVDYYRQGGSWEGVASLLADGVYLGKDWRGIRLGATLDESAGLEGRKRVADVLLADASGRVVFDSTGKDTGRPLGHEAYENAWPITEADDRDAIGYLLLFYPYTVPLGEPELQFLDRVEQILLVGAALAVVLILVVGALLSRRLNVPLQRLATAAQAVAAGNLDQQVETWSSTEVAEVGQAFNEMTAALKEAETLRQNMVADVAHELRTPLSVLQGNLWAIVNDAYPLEKAEISHLYDETRLLSRLVEDLRELALADAGQLYLNLMAVDVAQVTLHTVDTLDLAAEAQEVNLRAQVPDDLPPVLADPDLVAQVLRNLLINALRHTPPGGSVTVSAAAKDRTVEISIADTGTGIAPEDLQRVFERFWRADPARSRADKVGDERLVGGSGLGLAIARALVEAHNGAITVTSDGLGQGTRVCFDLPLH